MLLGVFISIYIMTLVLQIIVPFIVRETIVFGVTVPDQNIKHPALANVKKRYAQIVGGTGVVFLIVMIISYNLLTSESIQGMFLLGCLWSMLTVSMGLYWVYHQKISALKRQEQWGVNLKQVRAVDLTARSRDEMLPWSFFAVPLVISGFLIIYTILHYDQMPANIAVHWGPSGEADAWKSKTYLTAISLPLVMLMMQFMMWGITDSIKRSAIKIAVNRKEESLEDQLKTRKFMSWQILLVSYAITVLLTVLQLSNIYPSMTVGYKLLPLFVLFLAVVVGSLLIYVVKKRKYRVRYEKNIDSQVMDVDEDRYWKGGLIYMNRQDPSVFVEKRFGVGWTMNLANPRGYIVIGLPFLLLLLISIFSL
ncbi:DUF5808 domain-containing protein [Lysinibacillus sp. FSL M8-0216]|uniref:Uncharacterized membrane protein n=2 Tax=Bacillaceae TaxID=186817 RepID=A0A1H9PIP4_9BACI|nr:MULTISPECIES: DUF5808 domain-containing protein [Lysinibacillus]MCG7437517.1 DUF5808 domain-containing protein [Lysinibacillus fusiformis]MED4667813.1 DUF5808 domain-containing protein [Lysinibacillus fusiformis]PCD82927.1 DUF1648 domain-containing protein [Lysinibacillus fusiformis]QAS58179.1 DUF1648 domain-containing protein [Lysinibacillus sphaericus]RDV31750.1 DUF1648 domain-containing protein [Lysinibacillus fusiformis]